MREIIIDKEFSALLPTIKDEVYATLEKNIVRDGCREPLSLWKNILLDGHNRYKICQKNKIKFDTVDINLGSRDEAKVWIIDNQLGKRNLAAYQYFELVEHLEPLIRKEAKEKQFSTLKQGSKTPVLQNSVERQPIDTQKEMAEKAHMSHDTYYRCKEIAEKATEEDKKALRKGDLSINKVYSKINREQNRADKKQKVNEDIKNHPLPKDKYNVIYADPPWEYDFAETENRKIENQYPTMPLEEIKALKVPSADNCVLFLWATAPKLEQAFEVLRDWDFEYKSCMIWDKETLGMGYWSRVQHEILLVGTKGKMSPPEPEKRVRSVYREKKSTHSKKPDYYYKIIEEMFPNGKYIELFSRRKFNDKWSIWGINA